MVLSTGFDPKGPHPNTSFPPYLLLHDISEFTHDPAKCVHAKLCASVPMCVCVSMRACVYQEDASAQVGFRGSEEEAATGLQQGAGHLYMVVGEV